MIDVTDDVFYVIFLLKVHHLTFKDPVTRYSSKLSQLQEIFLVDGFYSEDF